MFPQIKNIEDIGLQWPFTIDKENIDGPCELFNYKEIDR